MAKTDDSVTRVLAHDWQASVLGVELGHHLTNADIEPTEKSIFTLKKS
jgi:hypothetical protein